MTLSEFVSRYKNCAVNVSSVGEAMAILEMFERHPQCYTKIDKSIKKIGFVSGIRFKDGKLFSIKTYGPYELNEPYGRDCSYLQAVINFNLLEEDAPMNFDGLESLL